MKISLGTVQFGLPYGAFNERGQITEEEAGAILEYAFSVGIDTLDTAQAYGASERVLGRLNASDRFRIISKCPPLKDSSQAADAVRRAADLSCTNLGTDKLDGFLLHRAEDLTGPTGDTVWRSLETLQAQGQIGKIGVSGYDPDVVKTLAARYPLELAQLPANVLDPWYENFDLAKGLELHVRSVFLQGFLLSELNQLSPFHAQWHSVLQDFRDRASRLGLTMLEAALAPLLNSSQIDRLVLGVDSIGQLKDIVAAASAPTISSLGPFDISPSALLDPRQWPSNLNDDRIKKNIR